MLLEYEHHRRETEERPRGAPVRCPSAHRPTKERKQHDSGHGAPKPRDELGAEAFAFQELAARTARRFDQRVQSGVPKLRPDQRERKSDEPYEPLPHAPTLTNHHEPDGENSVCRLMPWGFVSVW